MSTTQSYPAWIYFWACSQLRGRSVQVETRSCAGKERLEQWRQRLCDRLLDETISTVGIPNSLTPPSGLGISTRRPGLADTSRSSAALTSNQCSFRYGAVLPPSSRLCPVPPRRSTRFSAQRFCLQHSSHTHCSCVDFPPSRAGDGSALWSAPSGFTGFVCPAVPYPGNSAFLAHPSNCSIDSPSRRSALP